MSSTIGDACCPARGVQTSAPAARRSISPDTRRQLPNVQPKMPWRPESRLRPHRLEHGLRPSCPRPRRAWARPGLANRRPKDGSGDARGTEGTMPKQGRGAVSGARAWGPESGLQWHCAKSRALARVAQLGLVTGQRGLAGGFQVAAASLDGDRRDVRDHDSPPPRTPHGRTEVCATSIIRFHNAPAPARRAGPSPSVMRASQPSLGKWSVNTAVVPSRSANPLPETPITVTTYSVLVRNKGRPDVEKRRNLLGRRTIPSPTPPNSARSGKFTPRPKDEA